MDIHRNEASRDEGIYIDPRILEQPALHEDFGAWTGAPRHTPLDGEPANQYDLTSDLLDDVSSTPNDASYLFQEAHLENQLDGRSPQQSRPDVRTVPDQDSSMRQLEAQPGARDEVLRGLTRQQLRLTTSAPQGGPPVSASAAKSPSTPDIRVSDHDANYPPVEMDLYPASRRRAHTNPETLHGQRSPYALPSVASGSRNGGLLSPVSPERLIRDSYNVDRLSRTDFPTSFGSPATSCSTQSRSRSRSVSSAGSSVSSGLACNDARCNKRYKTLSALNHHKRSHTPYHLRPHVCIRCHSRFLFKKDLKRHWKNVDHSAPVNACSECGQVFGREDHLARHAKVHTSSEAGEGLGTASIVSSAPPSVPSSSALPSQPWMSNSDDQPSTPVTEDTTLSPQVASSSLYSRPGVEEVGLGLAGCDPFAESPVHMPSSLCRLFRSHSNRS